MVDQGATRYLGKAKVTEERTDAAGVTTYTFDAASGPVCLKGAPYLGGIEGLIGSNFGAVTFPPGIVEKIGMIELGGIDTVEVRGVTTATWFGAMIDGGAGWDDRLE